MKKQKKKLNRRINPEKSNKMILAVSFGLLILFGSLFIMITGSDSVKTREELFENTLSYLNRTEGITNIVSDPDSNSVKIYYEPDPNSRTKIDYKKMSVFAGVKLSHKLKDEKIRFFLIKKQEDKIDLSFTVLNGKVTDKSGIR
ncbi:MAG: hypothetical protein ABFR36_03115 [Acidobacteriota bacterium]